MSHLKERKEPTCLNCQTNPLYGRFCHVCGQENLEPKETVWHLVQHFFNDITHFDGKFFSTVKYLLKRPGFLSAEYVKGRRATYLNPIRMYVFTSAIFFIILFSLRSSRKIVQINNTPDKDSAVVKQLPDLLKDQVRLEARLKKSDDEDARSNYKESLSHLSLVVGEIKKNYGDSSTRKFNKKEIQELLFRGYEDTLKAPMPPAVRANFLRDYAVAKDTGFRASFFGWNQGKYQDVAQYDSMQKALPDSLQDGWFKTICMRRLVTIDAEYRNDSRSYQEHWVENFLHSIPKIMFISLPFFAMILRLLYVRRKQWLYVEHGIFTIHVYCAVFLATLVLILLKELSNAVSWGWFHTVAGILIFLLVMYMQIYLYKAMRRFYQQRRAKTVFKYFLLCFLALIVNGILLLLFLLISAISV